MSDEKYPIESISEDLLKDASIADCESLLSVLNQMSGTLRAKAHIVHAVMEAKQTARDAVRKSGGMTQDDKAALKAHWEAEDKIRADASLSDEDKAAALAKLNQVEDKPAPQHLMGSHIESESKVNPGQ